MSDSARAADSRREERSEDPRPLSRSLIRSIECEPELRRVYERALAGAVATDIDATHSGKADLQFIRIYAFAKELGMESKALVDLATRAGVLGKGSALASLNSEEQAIIRAYARGDREEASAITPDEVSSKKVRSILSDLSLENRGETVTILFSCPGCGAEYRLSNEAAGRSAKCPHCGTRFQVPSSGTVPADDSTLEAENTNRRVDAEQPRPAVTEPGLSIQRSVQGRTAPSEPKPGKRITGVVVRWDHERGFGFISREGEEDLFVHRTELPTGNYRCLVEGEPVAFEIGRRGNGWQAIGVTPAPGRLRGVVKKYLHQKGIGFIQKDGESERNLFFHYSQILGRGRQCPREGEIVEYDIGAGKKGSEAQRIKRVDPRYPLFRFAHVPDWLGQLCRLAEKAENEPWNYQRRPDPRFEFPILESYLLYTFERLETEKKIAVGSDGRRPYSCFNTGLVTDLQEELYALFRENPKHEEDGTPWELDSFYAANERILLGKFQALPELANYFDDPSQLLYYRNRPLIVDVRHIVEDNVDRFPSSCQDNPYLAQQVLESARSMTERRVYRNYKTAIPQFYHGELQLLLPLCLEKPNQADLALVVSSHGQQYRGDTVLPLDWAYNNARLLARPDTHWLNP